jgi:hypothetical protein
MICQHLEALIGSLVDRSGRYADNGRIPGDCSDHNGPGSDDGVRSYSTERWGYGADAKKNFVFDCDSTTQYGPGGDVHRFPQDAVMFNNGPGIDDCKIADARFSIYNSVGHYDYSDAKRCRRGYRGCGVNGCDNGIADILESLSQLTPESVFADGNNRISNSLFE